MRVGEYLCEMSIFWQDFCLKALNLLGFFYQQMGHFMGSIPTTLEGFFCYDLVLNHDRI